PDCMTYLTALLPVKDGVAVYGELHRRAMTAACDPDEHRSRGQVMADELVQRILTPSEGEPTQPAIELDLVKADDKTQVWVRRMYTEPSTGALITTDARRRDFPQVARLFLTARDQICRTPFCGAPIRHADHALAVAKGGETHLRNGNGRCESCNLTKDLAGWSTEIRADGTIVITTPTGHRHTSRAPQPPTSTPWQPMSPFERRLARQLDIVWPGAG